MFQIKNSSLALAAVEILSNSGFKINDGSISKALAGLKMPARFEVRRSKEHTIIIDGGHNPGAVKSFLEAYKKSPWGKRKRTFLFGVMKDKDYAEIIKKISKFAKDVILIPVNSKRNLEIEKLYKCWSRYLPADRIKVSKNVMEALRMAKNEKTVVVAGSLYLAGEIIKKGGTYDKTLFRN
jgi:dihydrofolate synthase/folylpolyglutamate synthase